MTGQQPLFSIDDISKAMLATIKQGIAVTKIRVWLTHVNIHTIWSSDQMTGVRMRKKYPLEFTMKRLMHEEPEVIDCRRFTAPWDIELPDPRPSLVQAALGGQVEAESPPSPGDLPAHDH